MNCCRKSTVIAVPMEMPCFIFCQTECKPTNCFYATPHHIAIHQETNYLHCPLISVLCNQPMLTTYPLSPLIHSHHLSILTTHFLSQATYSPSPIPCHLLLLACPPNHILTCLLLLTNPLSFTPHSNSLLFSH